MSANQRASRGPRLITVNEVQEAQLIRDRARVNYDGEQAKLADILQRQRELGRKVRINHWIEKARHLSDMSMTRVGAFINLIVLPSALALILASVLNLPVFVRAIALLAVASSVGLLGLNLFMPLDDELVRETERARSELNRLSNDKRRSEELTERAQSLLQRSESEYRHTLEEFQSRINRLRSTNWELMQGIEFENFLADVFLELGYKVETTKVTGDQGVDLVASKNGRSIAIQAKGYPSTTVGNKAVQEAHAGMGFYGCDVAVVITNSTYTSGARER